MSHSLVIPPAGVAQSQRAGVTEVLVSCFICQGAMWEPFVEPQAFRARGIYRLLFAFDVARCGRSRGASNGEVFGGPF